MKHALFCRVSGFRISSLILRPFPVLQCSDMNSSVSTSGITGWLKRYYPSVLMALFAVGISVGIYLLYRYYPERMETLKDYGYLGAFVISLLFNATVVLPTGNVLVLAALGAVMPLPFLVGIAAGIGAAVGESTGYLAGYSGRKIAERSPVYDRVEEWMRRWGSLTILLLSVLPLIFDVVGLTAGVLRFPFWKFFLLTLVGRSILYIAVAYGGVYGLPFLGIFIR